MPHFSHLHVHSQYSLLDGASFIPAMIKKASNDGMPGLALTDHGNMFGIYELVNETEKFNKQEGVSKVKPIIGCEFYVVADRHKRKFGGGERDYRYHQILLAKNAQGYRNLVKLCSLGYLEGLYGKYPRIDKELIEKYHEGLIATSCCLAAEVPRTIKHKGEEAGETALKWWLDLFGEDYYIELQRHGIADQDEVNEILVKLAQKHDVKVIASNDSHYVEQSAFNAHDILLCVNTGSKQSMPSWKEYGDDDETGKGRRFSFYNDQFFMKTTAQMADVFSDLPQALDNTNEIVDKIETLSLNKDILLPNFPVPKEFQIHSTGIISPYKKSLDADARNQWELLKHLTYIGARERYGELNEETRERIDFELQTVHDMGFAGYFLIVSDFIKAGREMGVFIGPGRGSAAGSVVAYCIGITNIDPLRYNLLFERFLNPERISMPDIDTDFDDTGRQKVIDYVVKKYGQNQVAQIVTFGTMAAKSSIKDVARVLDLDLGISNAMTKLVADKPGTTLKRTLHAPLTAKEGEKPLDADLQSEDIENAKKLREIYNYKGEDAVQTLQSKVLHEAEQLEGVVRNTGIHAAGVIIAPSDLTDLIPVCTAKDSELWVTQIEGSVIENVGVIKMDFLGLRNLTILKDALKLIKENHGVEIDPDKIPLDDAPTFELYQKSDTLGTFQFESDGMRQWLKLLKPDKIEDLIAMNALFRPGPMKYIPNYIDRKHGREAVKYDLPVMQEILEETYGITVYQEQVMLLSQKIAGFSKGKADELRKAMGKKIKAKLDELKPKFLEGGKANGHPEDVLNKIWVDWEDFAAYAFNKSHSTCYAILAYQTAYLKAHYPAEYMAALLTSQLGAIEKLTFYLDETRHMGLKVLGPDINESFLDFSVNKDGEIRFGLMALKGVGEAAAESIIQERNENGPFQTIFEFLKRVNLRTVNKTSMESLVQAGAFDRFREIHRGAFFFKETGEEITFIEKLIRFGGSYQAMQQSAQQSLFGEMSNMEIPDPKIPECHPWSNLEMLKREKIIAGFYISGHPLDDFYDEITHHCNATLKVAKEALNNNTIKEFVLAGIISSSRHEIAKSGNGYGRFTLEDADDSYEFTLFGEDYLKWRHLLNEDAALLVKAKVQSRFGKQDLFELKVTSMTLLSEVLDKFTKNIVLKIPVENLNTHLSQQILKAVKHKGDCKLRVVFIDYEENVKCEMHSGKTKVLCSEFLKEVRHMSGISYQLNS